MSNSSLANPLAPKVIFGAFFWVKFVEGDAIFLDCLQGLLYGVPRWGVAFFWLVGEVGDLLFF